MSIINCVVKPLTVAVGNVKRIAQSDARGVKKMANGIPLAILMVLWDILRVMRYFRKSYTTAINNCLSVTHCSPCNWFRKNHT